MEDERADSMCLRGTDTGKKGQSQEAFSGFLVVAVYCQWKTAVILCKTKPDIQGFVI